MYAWIWIGAYEVRAYMLLTGLQILLSLAGSTHFRSAVLGSNDMYP